MSYELKNLGYICETLGIIFQNLEKSRKIGGIRGEAWFFTARLAIGETQDAKNAKVAFCW